MGASASFRDVSKHLTYVPVAAPAAVVYEQPAVIAAPAYQYQYQHHYPQAEYYGDHHGYEGYDGGAYYV